jgi:hypothetical protein
MRVNDVRFKRPAQTDQSGQIANERQWVAFLTLAYLHSPHAMRVEKRIVMPSGAGIDDLMAFPRLCPQARSTATLTFPLQCMQCLIKWRMRIDFPERWLVVSSNIAVGIS